MTEAQRKMREQKKAAEIERGRKGKEGSANFIDSVEAALGDIGKAALMGPSYLAAKPSVDIARIIAENPEAARRVAGEMGKEALMSSPIGMARTIAENPEAARRVARKVGGAAQRSLETVSKATPPALAARLLDKALGDDEQEEDVSRSKGDRRARADKKEAREVARQQRDIQEALVDSFGLAAQGGLEGALAGAANREESLIIDDSQFEEPEEVDIDVSEIAPYTGFAPDDRPVSRAETRKLNKAERRKSLRDADAGFEEAFGERIGDYESRQGAEQEAAEKADALFKEPTLRAEPVPEMDEEESGRLFKMIMGSSFDPVSSMDKGKMEILKKAKAENPDLSDSQLALKIYKDYM